MSDITSLIAADTDPADAELDISGDVVLVATKLGVGESVRVKVYGLAADLENVINDTKVISLTRTNNSTRLAGPAKYHIYKSETAVSLGVGYYA